MSQDKQAAVLATEPQSLLEPIPEDKRIGLTFTNVSAWCSTLVQQPGLVSRASDALKKAVLSRSSGTEAPSEAPTQRQVLYSLSAELVPGEVFSLMGPSGSGKSTLISLIAGRPAKMMTTSGQVLYNGQPLSKSTKKRIGYVLQDDVLYESLTVFETLYYAAMLRLPKEMSKEDKARRVDNVMAALGLQKCAGTIIGGFFRRGVSGGERKRVSIGHELLINPAILMLDEPTSGLDSTTAMHLITTLRKLAAGGRAVLTTIHQPSSRLYQQLDRLMLLAEGHAIYYGASDQVVAWFAHLGFKLPYGINVADFILDLAMGEEQAGSQVAGKDAIHALWRTYEQFAETHPTGFAREDELASVSLQLEGADPAEVEVVVVKGADADAKEGQEGAAAPRAPTSTSEASSSLGRESGEAAPGGKGGLRLRWGGNDGEGRGAGAKEGRQGAAYLDQLLILLVRSIKTRRFDSLSGQRLLQLVLVAAITGMFWWQKGGKNTVDDSADTIGLLFFELLFPAFATMFAALFTFPADYRMLLKERASGMYQLSAYYIARIASDFPLDCTYPTLFVIIMYWMGGLRATAGAFFCNWLSVMLVVLLAQSIGLFVGATFMNPKTAQTITTVLMLTFMLVGGYYVRDIAPWISWLKHISFIFWGFNLLLKIEFRGVPIYDCDDNGLCIAVADVKHKLNLPVHPSDSVWLDVLVLVGMLVLFRVLVYIALRQKTAA